MSRDFWNSRYAGADYIFGEAPNDFLAEEVGRLPAGGRILSLGEGEGRNATFLAGRGFSVTGIDYAEAGRQKALALAGKAGVSFDYVVGDLNGFDMGEDVLDGVVCIFCHMASGERGPLFDRVRETLKPGGVFLAEVYHPDQLSFGTGGPSDLDLLIDLDEMLRHFASFEIVRAEKTIRVIAEGSRHAGRSCVTRIIARKPG